MTQDHNVSETITVALSGASGMPYGLKLIETCYRLNE